jgi:L-rhamnose-H+ transport protein
LFGLSVDRLGVSLANSLVIGLSSALGSVVPLLLKRPFVLESRHLLLFSGVAVFLVGVAICGAAGKGRKQVPEGRPFPFSLSTGYLFCLGAGVLSAVFNIGYSLALPIADAGVRLGMSRFSATNVIWLLMLGAGAVPNIVYCSWLLVRHRATVLFAATGAVRGFALSGSMGLLWGGSIFLYGAATPRLGELGPSVGWPLSLAVGLLVSNLMGVFLGEWRDAPRGSIRLMRSGIVSLLVAIAMCGLSAGA